MVIVLFAAASVLAPTATIQARDLVALSCDGDVPDEWRRPGGYCDQEKGTNSLSPLGTPPPEPTCIVVDWKGLQKEGDEVIVAGIDPCCLNFGSLGDEFQLEEGTRVDVAVSCCPISMITEDAGEDFGVLLVAC